MLERFKIPEKDVIRVNEEPLRKIVVAMFEKVGVPKADCILAADVLITADLRGVESHGVSNLLWKYIQGFQNGEVKANPQWSIVSESPAAASIDCDTGLGTIITPKAMEKAIEKAKDVGLGMVTMCHGRHLGMAAYHAMLALKHNMIGICMTVAPPSMPPTFGAEPRVGTNPIALAAPAGKEVPFVYDAATTVIAGNKIELASRLGVNLLPGWVAGADGTPIMEEMPAPARHEVVKGWSTYLLPLGSIREMGSHKGYGLSCIVEILSGILTGGGYGAKLGRPNFNHCVAALNIEAFMEIEQFKQTMDEFLQMLRTTRPAPGHQRVYYPGLLEAERELEYRAKGIPLHYEVVEWIRNKCKDLSITCPF